MSTIPNIPATSTNDLTWLKWTAIGFIIVFTTAGVAAVVVHIIRLREYSREYAMETAAHEAERQRLLQLLYHLHLTSRPPKDERPAVWAYQPDANQGLCMHGMVHAPEGEFQTGYRQAFLDVCSICHPDYTLSEHGVVPENVVNGLSSLKIPALGPPRKNLQGQRSIRLRLAKGSLEFPPVPPPQAPIGFKAVPMVLEW